MNKDKKSDFQMPKIIKDNKFQTGLVIVLFLLTLFIGLNIRLQPMMGQNLIDESTGDFTPFDLDSYYFLRHSKTLLENNMEYPLVDNMRYPTLSPGYNLETMPYAVVFLFKIINLFDDSKTIMFANVLSPALFFALGLIAFFFLVLVLTKNKWTALFSSTLLTLVPTYLYRTLAGSSDHDSFGMLGFFLALLSFYYFFNKLQSTKTKNYFSIIFGLIAGFFSMFSITSWGGSGAFIFMIIPLTYLLNWFVNKESNQLRNVSFYGSWILGILLSAPIFNYSSFGILKSYMFSVSGIFTLVALAFTAFDFVIRKYDFNKEIKKYSQIIALGLTIFLGIVFYQILVGHVFELIIDFLRTVLTPFGTGRVGLTVSENAQPYLKDLISQLGNVLFFAFVAGIIVIGIKIMSGIEKKELRAVWIISYLFFIFGLLFTRISSTSILNGDNFLSKAIMLISILFVLGSSLYVYIKSKWKIDFEWISLLIISIVMILSVRSAIRVFFVIVPFVLMIIFVFLNELYKYIFITKEDLAKVLSIAILGFLIISIIFSSFGFYKSSFNQAKYQTPPYNADWQNAMSWVRENTHENDIFLHWWDYGYWVQTGGERPTITDGGHFNMYWDHLIARYVLTTPKPETAKSFMKAHKVSYLLIDPTDLGKYGSYSSIADDNESSDRYSFLITFASDPTQTQETRNGTLRVYQGGIYLSEDIRYKNESMDLFLPRNKAVIAGIILESNKESASQPIAVYVHNNKQYRLPMRFLFINGELFDFGSGVNATAYIYPLVYSSSGIQKIDEHGSAIYLSNKNKDSLFVQLYLMNDPNNLYPELELVKVEFKYPFAFYYGGYQGPIKIWKINKEEMTDIITRPEFLYTEGIYGELDDLEFIK